MTALEAIILGIIQGLTEFLPVSSSGHLVLFQQLLGLKEAELFFDVGVHLGTLVAVVIVFRQEIIKILLALLQLVSIMGQKEKFLQKVQS
ncbi:MAG: undecaprenyl-diphosphate phosphatase, partial [Desulfobacterales bacterium]